MITRGRRLWTLRGLRRCDIFKGPCVRDNSGFAAINLSPLICLSRKKIGAPLGKGKLLLLLSGGLDLFRMANVFKILLS